jgi:hypothetical protein
MLNDSSNRRVTQVQMNISTFALVEAGSPLHAAVLMGDDARGVPRPIMRSEAKKLR